MDKDYEDHETPPWHLPDWDEKIKKAKEEEKQKMKEWYVKYWGDHFDAGEDKTPEQEKAEKERK